MLSAIKQLWLKISETNRKRIVSFANTFVTTSLVLLAASLNSEFPVSLAAAGALAMSILRSAVREALNALVASLGERK